MLYSNDYIKLFKLTNKNPVSLMDYFRYNIKYVENPMNNKQINISWPQDVMDNKSGNCLDFSLFVHYWSNYYNLDNALLFLSIYERNNKILKNYIGHIIPFIKINEFVYVWNFMNDKEGFVSGPFANYNLAFSAVIGYFQVLASKILYVDNKYLNLYKIPPVIANSILEGNQLDNIIDENNLFNKKNIKQSILLDLIDKVNNVKLNSKINISYFNKNDINTSNKFIINSKQYSKEEIKLYKKYFKNKIITDAEYFE